MKKLLLILIFVIFLVGCSYEEGILTVDFNKLKQSTTKVNDKITIEEKSKQLEKECKSEINNNVELLRKKIASGHKLDFVDYKIFDNKEKALEYIEFWHSDTFESGTRAKKDLTQDINKTIFIGVVKLDLGFTQMGVGGISSGTDIAINYPLVCIDGEIKSNSEYVLKKLII